MSSENAGKPGAASGQGDAVVVEDAAATEAAPAPGQPAAGFIGIGETRPEKVLLVDDSATTRRIIKTLLKRLGYKHITEAEDGAEGFQKMGEAEFDLVISDWTMNPVSGLELVAKIRSMEEYKNVPFIMVSTARSVEDVVRAKAAGVDAYIVKPFDAKGLQDKINMAVQ